MSVNLIGPDIQLMRDRYDEALEMQGIPCTYQYPILASTNEQGEPVADRLSAKEDTHIFFDGNPKVKTYKRLGWVVENDSELPFLIHCSFNLKHLQKDCIFTLSGQYTGLPDRMFRVTELTCDLQAPDHMICKVIPVYDDGTRPVGRINVEVAQTYNKSNRFLKDPSDYRGDYHTTKEEKEY